MLCLDTTFIIDILKNKQDASTKYKEIKFEDLVTTQINAYEIKSGIHRKFDENIIQNELSIFHNLLASINILNINTNSVERAAEINGELTKSGLIVDDLDILIAGICLANGCNRIITKNVKHFSRIKELKVESY